MFQGVGATDLRAATSRTAAPPCIRHRRFPLTAGDLHDCPDRVRAPQRGALCIRSLFKRHHAKAVAKSESGQHGVTAWTEITYNQGGKEIAHHVYAIDSSTDEEACEITLTKHKANKYTGFRKM